MATELDGRILLSNVKSWRLDAMSTIVQSQQQLPKINQPQVYLPATSSLTLLEKVEQFFALKTAASTLTANDLAKIQSTLLTLSSPFDEKGKVHYLAVAKDVPLLEWRIHVLVDLTPVKTQRLSTIIFGVLILALMVLLIWVIFERQRRSIERIRHQRAFSLRLERQVRDRTHELTTTNTRLEREVHERKLAEHALRETQQDLVQAAKLAGIGQMSAALAHEYNQPLAAIRSYADNALQLLALAKEEDVQDNLRRITGLTERMADLTKTLRSFAHKSKVSEEVVPLSAIMDEMIILLSPQAKKQAVELIVTAPSVPVSVLAGQLRLSQVIINVVTNAMDAVKDSAVQRVEVYWYQHDKEAVIAIKDTGQGIPEDVKDKMFTPFFTTKGVGAGLGLGLFIVYNMIKEFRGSIEVTQEEGYGCVFTIILPLAESGQ
jgi:two-component system C4-dicarboxylate transport sensor histidine kinase DctB